jgi:hypothetical protein
MGADNRKLTIEQIRPLFQKRNYTLLSSEYINTHSKLKFICPNGHRGEISWVCFGPRRQGCSACYGNKKKTIQETQKAFKKRKYILLSSEYVNCDVKLSYTCPEGHTGQISWNNFNQGQGCPICYGNAKVNIEQIRFFFEKVGYSLLSSDCLNNSDRLYYMCPKGHRGQVSWNNFSHGHRCPQCYEWKNQKRLGEVLEQLFPGKVKRQDNLEFLKRQKVDFSIRDLRLAFEYDGQQHFNPVRFGGISQKEAISLFKNMVRLDKQKNKLCQENNIRLVRIRYNEPLTIEYIKSKIEQMSIGEQVK